MARTMIFRSARINWRMKPSEFAIAMDDPALALAEAATSVKFDEADSIAEQIESSIKARDLSPIAFWFRKLGPVIGPLVERACDQAVRRRRHLEKSRLQRL